MKNVLVLHPGSDLYGASKVFVNSISVMQSLNYNVIVMLPYEGALSELLRNNGVEVIHQNLGVIRRKYLNIPGIFNRLNRFIRAYKSISRFIKERDISLIYTNTSVVWVGAVVAKRKRINHIVHIHEIPESSRLFGQLAAPVFNKSALVIAVSNGVKNYWSNLLSNPLIEKVYNGFDFEHINEAPLLSNSYKHILLAIGRIQLLKGQQYLLEIAESLLKRREDFEIWIAGSAFSGNEAYETDLRASVIKKNLSDHVKFLGQREDVPHLLAKAEMLIHPSIQPDSLPTTILEALAAGTPVVATDILGANEILVNEINGVLIPLMDEENSARIISDLIDNRELQIKIAAEGKKTISEHFTKEKYHQQLKSLLEHVN